MTPSFTQLTTQSLDMLNKGKRGEHVIYTGRFVNYLENSSIRGCYFNWRILIMKVCFNAKFWWNVEG